MKPIKQLLRLAHINHVLAKNGLDQVIVSIRLFAPLRFIVYFNPWNWFRKNTLTRGEALRKTLIELGPIFVKFGQALSTRPDILPADIAIELSQLQDNVPPFSSAKALAIIEGAFGRSAFDVFAHFDSEVLASASMAQVHAARLKSGEEVVVKVLRPNMRKKIDQDIRILYTIASLTHRYWAEGKRLRPKEIVREFERSLLGELDLQREAANASQLRRNFENSPLLYVPTIHWDYVRKNVMVMERVHGIPVSDVTSLKQHGINIKKLAERGLEIFFTQVFRDCFFHADMHPGNIFVSYQNPEDPKYICIDFGIMGTLNQEDKRYLAENMLAFFNRDYRRVAELHIASGWVARNTCVEDLESAIRTVCEPIFGKPLKDISLGLIVLNLFQVARQFNMTVQPQLVLLQKTLLAIEGLGRQLYPELDLWSTAQPFLEKWLKKQVGFRAFVGHLKNNLPFMIEQLPYIPKLFQEVLQLTKEQQLLTKEKLQRAHSLSRVKSSRFKIGMSIFAVTLAFALALRSQWFTQEQLTTIAFVTASVSVTLAFFNRKKEK